MDSIVKRLPAAQAVTLSGAVLLGLLALKYNDRAIFSEKPDDRIPRTPGTQPLVGDLFTMIAAKNRMYDYLTECFENLNTLTMYSSALGMPPIIRTIDPDNIEYVLKTNFPNYVKSDYVISCLTDFLGHGIFVANGEQWRYQRKTASHIFNVANFRDHFTDIFVSEARIMMSHIFDKKAENGEPVDFHDVMYKFTLESFVLLGFGVQINALRTKGPVQFAASFDACQAHASDRILNPAADLLEFIRCLLNPTRTSVREHHRILNDFAYSIIREHRQSNAAADRKDLLHRFMNAKNEKGEKLSDEELRDAVLNFVIAGRDTTAGTLSWTFYNLMLHPRVENKLFEEIQQYIVDEHESDSPALYEVIKSMKYAHAVLYETLRFHPSVPTNSRQALEDDVLPDGTPVKKGTRVQYSAYSLGRSTKIWGPDAKEFRPERWLDPETGELRRESQGRWPVFHAGPRVCLGQGLATLEALVAIIMLVRRYKFTLVPNQSIEYAVTLTMPMKHGMKVYVQTRN